MRIPGQADTWDALQRFQIARLLAQEGDSLARHAMTGAFERNVGSSMQDMFAEEFIILDGIPGLLFAMGRIGCGLGAGSHRWVDDYLLSTAENAFGKQPVGNAVMARARTNRNVAAYVEAVNANRLLRQGQRRRDPASLSYEQIRSMILSGKTEGYLVKWGQTANPSSWNSRPRTSSGGLIRQGFAPTSLSSGRGRSPSVATIFFGWRPCLMVRSHDTH